MGFIVRGSYWPGRYLLVAVAAAMLLLGAALALRAERAQAYSTAENCYWPTIQRHGAFGWTDNAAGDGHNAFLAAKNGWNNTNTKINLSGSGSGIITDNPNLGNTGDDGITHYACTSGRFDYAHSDLNSYYTAYYAGTQRQSVAAHEFGHAFGLSHSNQSVCPGMPLMDGTTSVRWGQCGVYTPQSDDVNGINHIYGAP